MLFPCRKHVAKVTEESECERGCDIPWIPGLLLQTWSAALHPGGACKLLFTHANAAFCCSRHRNGVVFLLFAQASHQRTTQAILALSGPAVFAPHPPSHLWSLNQLCFHFFPLSFCLCLYIDGVSSFSLCSLVSSLISSLPVNIRAASSEQPELTPPLLKSTAQGWRLPKKLKRQHHTAVWAKSRIITEVVHAVEASCVRISLLSVKLGRIVLFF